MREIAADKNLALPRSLAYCSGVRVSQQPLCPWRSPAR